MKSGKGNVDIENWKVELGKLKVESGTRNMVPGKWHVEVELEVEEEVDWK